MVMDDDDEIHSVNSIHSNPSPASGSPSPVSSPGAIGRISVTVAAPAANSYALALPIQNTTRGSNGGGREDCWSEAATAVLIEAWGERYLELSRGNLKQKHWKEVAEIVNGRGDYLKAPKTDVQCKNRIDTVKKKYKSEKAKIGAGGGSGGVTTSTWRFYDRLDQLIGPTAKISGVSGTNHIGNSNLPQQKVPLGIPVGIRASGARGANQVNSQKKDIQQAQLNYQKIQLRPRVSELNSSDNSSEKEALSPMSSDSLPPPERKRAKVMNSNSKGRGWGSAVRELTQAIVKFGEAYEQAETSKLQQVVEMEKQRMKFAKDLELQRMQFFMKTQVEISQLKLGRKSVNVNGNTSNHQNNNNVSSNNNNSNHNNNSDSE